MKELTPRKKLLQQAKLQKLSTQILQKLKEKNAAVEVVLLPDKEMRMLEKRYMKKEKKIVDVLSFAHPKNFPQPESKKRWLGEVYLNSELYPENFEKLAFLLIHGILHLLGYDHEKRRDTIRMEALEAKVMTQLPRVFPKKDR